MLGSLEVAVIRRPFSCRPGWFSRRVASSLFIDSTRILPDSVGRNRLILSWSRTGSNVDPRSRRICFGSGVLTLSTRIVYEPLTRRRGAGRAVVWMAGIFGCFLAGGALFTTVVYMVARFVKVALGGVEPGVVVLLAAVLEPCLVPAAWLVLASGCLVLTVVPGV